MVTGAMVAVGSEVATTTAVGSGAGVAWQAASMRAITAQIINFTVKFASVS